MRFRTRPRRPVQVDITPLVDVVFMLVIFFTVTTHFKANNGLTVQLPQAASSEALAQQDQPKELVIDEQGRFFVEGELVVKGQLEEKLRLLLLRGEQEPLLLIKADRNTKHGAVVFALDCARGAGITRTAIAIEADSEAR